LVILVGVFLMMLVARLAARKGYNLFLWFFAGGLSVPSLLVLAFLPFTNKDDIPADVAARRRTRGNIIGLVLAIITLVTFCFQLPAVGN